MPSSTAATSIAHADLLLRSCQAEAGRDLLPRNGSFAGFNPGASGPGGFQVGQVLGCRVEAVQVVVLAPPPGCRPDGRRMDVQGGVVILHRYTSRGTTIAARVLVRGAGRVVVARAGGVTSTPVVVRGA
ncbi:hypothetical protein BN12_770004 [Nostocoides japonicum T1-X7]|uniref:Uncharacterized protein n=1 Tax=Nostocoides japonicum T1-X7 TaxID=1194083 RepID=A0A077M7W6_9MICO|nr:hypothetical protein BN12_770004 [Tetrasphaera japonica T1-X7]